MLETQTSLVGQLCVLTLPFICSVLFSYVHAHECVLTEVISALLAFSTVASRNEIKSGAEMPNT